MGGKEIIDTGKLIKFHSQHAEDDDLAPVGKVCRGFWLILRLQANKILLVGLQEILSLEIPLNLITNEKKLILASKYRAK